MSNVWTGIVKYKRQIIVLLLAGGLFGGYYEYVDSLHYHPAEVVMNYGPVTQVVYTGSEQNTTNIRENGLPFTNLCGDLSSEIAVGSSYRLQGKEKEYTYKEFGNVTSSECLDVKNAEEYKSNVDMQQIYGSFINTANPDKYSFAFDVHLATEIDEKPIGKSKIETINLCNDQFSLFVFPMNDADFYSSLNDYRARLNFPENKPLVVTIYYNKADRSPRYGCYPLLAIRVEDADHPDNRPVFVSPNVKSYFHEDNQTFLKRLEEHFYGD